MCTVYVCTSTYVHVYVRRTRSYVRKEQKSINVFRVSGAHYVAIEPQIRIFVGLIFLYLFFEREKKNLSKHFSIAEGTSTGVFSRVVLCTLDFDVNIISSSYRALSRKFYDFSLDSTIRM